MATMVVEESPMRLLSDVGNDEDVPLGGGGAQVLRIENVYMEAGDCERGEQIGVVYIEEAETGHGDRVLVTATFELNDEDSFVVGGIARRIMHDDRPSFRGRLGIRGGTGKYKGGRGQADVDVCNPKRWIIDLGP